MAKKVFWCKQKGWASASSVLWQIARCCEQNVPTSQCETRRMCPWSKGEKRQVQKGYFSLTLWVWMKRKENQLKPRVDNRTLTKSCWLGQFSSWSWCSISPSSSKALSCVRIVCLPVTLHSHHSDWVHAELRILLPLMLSPITPCVLP